MTSDRIGRPGLGDLRRIAASTPPLGLVVVGRLRFRRITADHLIPVTCVTGGRLNDHATIRSMGLCINIVLYPQEALIFISTSPAHNNPSRLAVSLWRESRSPVTAHRPTPPPTQSTPALHPQTHAESWESGTPLVSRAQRLPPEYPLLLPVTVLFELTAIGLTPAFIDYLAWDECSCVS